MKTEREITIISGFLGFTIGVCGMLFVNIDQKQKTFEKDIQLDSNNKFLIQENIGTCEDMIEWMNYDVEMYTDSTIFDTYILNLENMIEENRNILQTKYDY